MIAVNIGILKYILRRLNTKTAKKQPIVYTLKCMRYSLIFLFVFLYQLGNSQDIHFSQFYLSPLNLNPALTGVSEHSQRYIFNYRSQWSPALGAANAYNTSSFSYDTRRPVGELDYFGIGGTLWGDVAGESNLATVQAKLSASYQKYLNGNSKRSSYLVVGGDVGFTQRRVSTDNLRWPQQHDGIGGFNAGAPSGEIDRIDNNQIDPINYPDVSVGVLYFNSSDKALSYFGGVAFSHINRPNISFLGAVSNLFVRTTINAGAEIPFNPRVSVLPNAIVLIQGPHREYNLGANLRYRLNDTNAGRQYVQLGAWFRTGNSIDSSIHADAFIVSIRVDNGSFGIGLSYDATVSDFRSAAPANGSFELSANYYIPGKKRRGVFCPKF